MKKNTALHWRESQDINYTRGKKNGYQTEKASDLSF